MLHPLIRLMRCVALVCVLACMAYAPAAAQTAAPSPAAATQAPPAPSALIDQAKTQLDQVLAALQRDSLDDAALLALRAQIDPARVAVQGAIDALTPQLANYKARLDQIGPKSEDKETPESPNVTSERAEQQQHYDETDEALKRAKLLALQIEQASETIVSRRRAIFVNTVFHRSYSVAAPALWQAVAHEVPADARALRYVAEDFIANASSKLDGWRLPLFLALVTLVGLLNIPAYGVVRRILRRESGVAKPDRRAKAIGAAWIAIVVAILPIVTIIVLFALFDLFDLGSPRLVPLKRAVIEGVARISLTVGLARGLIAPSRPNWRLVPMADATAERLSRLAIAVAVIASVTKIVDSLNEAIGAAVAVTAATQGLGALAFSIALAAAIYGLGDPDEDDEDAPAARSARSRWAGPLRVLAWAVLIVVVVATLLGYVPFASFLVGQALWIAGVLSAFFILHPLLTETIEHAFRPTTRLGRLLVSNFGARREGLAQLGILLSGVVQLLLLGLAAFAIIVPWGVQSADLADALRSGFFEIRIGEVTISPSSIIVALILFGAGYAATRGLQSWLDQRLMPATSLDVGLRNSIRTSVGYIGYFLAAGLALAHVGLSFDRIAIIAGGLSLGIGFGLQSIFNNFVSGIIVLWERSLRVGDWVVIGDEQGFVRKINVRATEIETFDRATMIVPNSNLITGVVKNWVRNDRVGRIRIPVSINTGVDPETVRGIMTGAAKAHDQVAKIPAPMTLFVSMEPAGLKFELICFVEEVETSSRVKSDLHYEIFKSFGEAGISLGSPGSMQVTLQGVAPDKVADALRDEAR